MKIEINVELVKVEAEREGLVREICVDRYIPAVWERYAEVGGVVKNFKILGVVNIGNIRDALIESGAQIINEKELKELSDPYDFY